MIRKLPPHYRDYNRDPNIKALTNYKKEFHKSGVYINVEPEPKAIPSLEPLMSYSLNSSKGFTYYYRGHKGDTRPLDYGSYGPISKGK